MEKKMLKLITFQSPIFSPSKFKSHDGKGFSGQIITVETHRTAAEAEEPTSPKISCMGKIKHKHKQRKNKKIEGQKAKESSLKRFFVKPQEKRSGIPRPRPKVPERVSRAPDFGHMRRYASTHTTMSAFDWRAQGVYHDHVPSNEDSEGENEVIIPFSAPMIMGGLGGCGNTNVELKPKKEINLWKRRTMAQPRPLQVAPLR